MTIAVLVVCVGNICRSPAAEAFLSHIAKLDPDVPELFVASCGIGAWMEGRPPHPTVQAMSLKRGVALSGKAQLFRLEFFDQFDYILAVDREVMEQLQTWTVDPSHREKIYMVTSFSSSFRDQDIPDPLIGDDGTFEKVLDMIEDSCRGFLTHLKEKKI